MLTGRPRSRRWLALWTIVAALTAAGAVGLIRGPDVLAAPPSCDPTPDGSECGGGIGGTNPGGGNGGGNDGGNGGSGPCEWGGRVVPCYDPLLGWFSNGCYYRVATPQSPSRPEGHTTYVRSCIDSGGAQEQIDLPESPIGVPPDPEDIAWDIFAGINLLKPVIHTAPRSAAEDPNARALVGLPIWLWTEETEGVWGPIVDSDTQGGLFVELTAQVTSIEWDMGDGTEITCTEPGTPWTESAGDSPSPDCGYPKGYQESSRDQPGGRYPVTATTTWTVDWEASNGEDGSLPDQILTSETSILVDEMQVVNR